MAPDSTLQSSFADLRAGPWWGKLGGALVGYLLGGPLAALLGLVLGHNIDRGLSRGGFRFKRGNPEKQRQQAQTAFFNTTFSVMGRLATVDGGVNASEYTVVNNLMDRLQLGDEQKRIAIKLFESGLAPGFGLRAALKRLKQDCRGHRNLLRVFLEGQLHAAYADGELNRREKDMLLEMFHVLGFSDKEFQNLDAMVRIQLNLEVASHEAGVPAWQQARRMTVEEACEVLGVRADDTEEHIQREYRRLMNQHHPDKLLARGLPEEMVSLAAEQTAEIRMAWECLRENRREHSS